MVDIKVGDVYSELVTTDVRVFGIARMACRARPRGFQFTRKFKSGQWDGFISLMHTRSKFPTGLLDIVVNKLRESGYETRILVKKFEDEFLPITEDMLEGITLRDYQIEAAKSLLSSVRGVANMATNSGKTEVIAAVTKAVQGQSIIVVHRKELMYQTAKRLSERLGCDVGRIGDELWEPKECTVAMVQTLHSRENYDWCKDNKLVAVDECHHLSSNEYLDVFSKIPGRYRFGFSGTALKYDDLSDMKLIGATGDVITNISNQFLIEEGYSARPCIYVHTIERENDEDEELKYRDAYDKLIVENDTRNEIISKLAKDSEGVVLILVVRVKHGKILKRLIKGSVFVFGSNSTEARMKVLQDMKDGKAGVYIASTIFDEGVDVPGVDTVILAGGGKSYIKQLQRIGRGLRAKDDGKNELIVHDFLDDTNKYLFDHSVRRMGLYGEEGFTKKIAKR